MKIRIGTRKSRLALIQTELVKEKIEQAFPEAEVEVFKLSTKGDEQLDRSLTSFGGKGVFTRELEEALLLGEIDLAVHSAKDMPMEFPQGLEIGAVLERADVRDVFVTTSGVKAADLPAGSIVGTSSLRRELQIKAMNPLVRIALLRGNVETRLRKLRKGQYDGILLAAAGLERLGLLKEPDLHLEYLDPDTFLPAAGQGILAVEAKEGRLTEVLSAIHCQEAALALEARGIYPDFVPSRYSSKDLAAEWIPGLTGKDRVLLLRAKEASRELTEALEQAEIPYQSIPLYTTETDRRKEEELKRMLPSVDYITFASASAVKAFVGMAGDLSGLKAKVICIGPVTEREARKAGLQVRRSAVDYTAEGIRDVLLREKQLT